MPGLDPGIYVFGTTRKKVVDGRDKPGHDTVAYSSSIAWYLPASSIAVPQILCEAWCSARP
jgi:hypothetical protein